MRILLFIGLKVVEILAGVFVPYLVGRITPLIPPYSKDITGFEYWFMGLITIAFAVLIIIVVIAFVKVNWHWAKKLSAAKEAERIIREDPFL